MKTTEYLEQSKKTLAPNDNIGRDIFTNDFDVLMQGLSITYGGHEADALKRSLFYKDPKIEERLEKAKANMKLLQAGISQNKDTLNITDAKFDLLHAILGIISEATEVMDELIASVIENRDTDNVNLKEEAGDIQWYCAVLLRYLGLSYEEAFAANIAKLQARYPHKFNSEDALNRDVDKEREIIESTKADAV